MNGDDGSDDIEVNGAPAAGDAFSVQPNGSRVAFKRTNLVPFSLDIGSSETMHANGLGGDDAITVGDVGSFEVTAAGGAGNDTLTGGSGSETFLGGSGDDTINPGGGLDVVSGGDGNDTVNVRDNTADVARGDNGTDSVIADTPDLDILDGFESVDRTQVDPPAPVDNATRPVKIAGGTVKVSRSARIAAIKVSCPADSPGNCTGSLILRTAHHVHVAGLSAIFELGSARYDVAPGATQTLKLKLPKGTERLADRKGHLKALVIASTGSSGSIASTTQGLTLALGTAKKAR
jgi:Ca2+-binding RTX toxin-like protein